MDTSPIKFLAKKFLKDLNILSPTDIQIDKVTDLLKNNSIQAQVLFDHKLTHQENACLLLAAYGKTSHTTAALLNVSKETIETHRKEIRRKLECSSMAQAVYQGIRYGLLKKDAI